MAIIYPAALSFLCLPTTLTLGDNKFLNTFTTSAVIYYIFSFKITHITYALKFVFGDVVIHSYL